jgi:hypothetical protein
MSAQCLLCGQVVDGLCPGVNIMPGVVYQNYTAMMQQRVYDWVVGQSQMAAPANLARSVLYREGGEK